MSGLFLSQAATLRVELHIAEHLSVDAPLKSDAGVMVSRLASVSNDCGFRFQPAVPPQNTGGWRPRPEPDLAIEFRSPNGLAQDRDNRATSCCARSAEGLSAALPTRDLTSQDSASRS